MSIKLIPNPERVQIEKAQIAKDIKLMKLDKLYDSDLSGNSKSISFEHDAGDLDDLN